MIQVSELVFTRDRWRELMTLKSSSRGHKARNLYPAVAGSHLSLWSSRTTWSSSEREDDWDKDCWASGPGSFPLVTIVSLAMRRHA